MSDLTPYEQYLLELINRARADPGAEAARLGIDLNQGLASGTIQNTAKQPLAANAFLNTAAADHSAWMLQADVFSHTGQNGSSAGDRIETAGYDGWRAWGENISYRGGGNVQTVAVVQGHHDGLFKSSGHRKNLLNDGFSEIGLGQEYGAFNGFSASMLTQNFATDRGAPFLLGVVFDDLDGDDFFDPGEELPDVDVAVSGTGATATGAGGGYEIRVAGDGAYTVTFSGGGLAAPVTRTVRIGEENVKLDILAADAIPVTPDPPADPEPPVIVADPTPTTPTTPVTPTDPDPPATPTGGGEGGQPDTASPDAPDPQTPTPGTSTPGTSTTAPDPDMPTPAPGRVRLSGDEGDNRMRGGDADEVMRAGGGDDIVRGRGGDDVLRGQKGDDRLIGGRGDDTLGGGGGRDHLKGGGGEDVLRGGGGADTLKGGGGDDLLIGGGGRDVFQFTANGGDDVIQRYDALRDLIAIQSGAAAFEDLDISQTDAGALIAFANASILVEGRDAGDIAAGDFIFT